MMQESPILNNMICLNNLTDFKNFMLIISIISPYFFLTGEVEGKKKTL